MKVLIVVNNLNILKKKLVRLIPLISDKLILHHVIDMETKLIPKRVVYLSEVSNTKHLGESITYSPTLMQKMMDNFISDGQQMLDDAAKLLPETTNTVLQIGNPISETVKYINDNNINVVIMAKSWKFWPFTNIPKEIRKKASCRVLIV